MHRPRGSQAGALARQTRRVVAKTPCRALVSRTPGFDPTLPSYGDDSTPTRARARMLTECYEHCTHGYRVGIIDVISGDLDAHPCPPVYAGARPPYLPA